MRPNIRPIPAVAAIACVFLLAFIGCSALNPVNKTTTVTNGVTNVTYSVNQTALDADCAGMGIVGTPLVTAVLNNNPGARQILIDIQTSLNSAANGVDAATQNQIEVLISKNATVQSQLAPLIQGVSALRGQLLQKYGGNVAVQISLALAKELQVIISAALTATQ